MRLSALLFTLVGIGLAVVLVALNDAGSVVDAFLLFGGGLVPVVAIRAVIITVCAAGWAALMPERRDLPPWVWVVLRWIREGINVLLPVATVGGEVVGARLITFWGVGAGSAGAGILVDLLVQAIGQAIFALIGVLLLSRVSGAETLRGWLLDGLAVAGLALAGFFATLRFGMVGVIERFIAARAAGWAQRFSGGLAFAPLRLTEALGGIFRRPGWLAASVILHVAGWLIGTLEIWVALAWSGHPVALADALILESLGQAVRGAAFPVPGALGVQEAGFVLLGRLMGIDPATALALSLVKRVPDVVLGLPALVAWYRLETRRRTAVAMAAAAGE